MAGQIKSMLNSIIKIRSKGNETIALTTKTKLIFKGFDPTALTAGLLMTLPSSKRSKPLPSIWESAYRPIPRRNTMPITTAYSTKGLPDAVADLKTESAGGKSRAVLYFASSKYDLAKLSRQMQDAFPHACVAGCSTAGEIAGGKMMRESVAAIFLDEETVGQSASAVVENLRDHVARVGCIRKNGAAI